jgi:hypothetical protein
MFSSLVFWNKWEEEVGGLKDGEWCSRLMSKTSYGLQITPKFYWWVLPQNNMFSNETF